MKRLARIALREYLAYVRTIGFWLSILLLPLFISAYTFGPIAVQRSNPVAEVTVVDFSGRNLATDIADSFKVKPGERPTGRLVDPPGGPFATAARATTGLKGYLSGERLLPDGEKLEAAVIIVPKGESVAIDYWSRNIADRSLERTVEGAVSDALRRERFQAAGLSPAMLDEIEAAAPTLASYSPKAATGKVTLKDRLPAYTGFAIGMMLFTVILTGAGMLLNSIIEEKSSRILEVLLTSASAPEIMIGKILGVAMVTSTVLTVWLTLAGIGLATRFPGVAVDLAALLIDKGLIFYFAFYFIGGYLMFATLYVTIGAFCESVREAQTLLGPMMLLMVTPIAFMGQTLTAPDAPLLRIVEWIPLFTPFMMSARVASGPPAWEIVGTGALMVVVTAIEMWFAIPAFKSGALATGRFEFRKFLASLVAKAP